nr:hypothetical protein BaRGS_026339 [Batillaria attramentaria]
MVEAEACSAQDERRQGSNCCSQPLMSAERLLTSCVAARAVTGAGDKHRLGFTAHYPIPQSQNKTFSK